ncbi:hypothetical protein SDJN03_10679, partial [Cucurbita argyrosperma subsp. sororia]
MGCGESKLAVATADGSLPRKKSSASRTKSSRKAVDGSKREGEGEAVKVKEAAEAQSSGTPLLPTQEKTVKDANENAADSAVKEKK